MNELDARIQALPPGRRALLEKLRRNGGRTEKPQVPHEPPATPTERVLATVWAEVLGREPVGRQDSFFELGGDSIQSIQIVAKLRQFGLDISTKQIFDEPVLWRLALLTKPVAGEIDQTPATGAAPLSPVQRWFFQQAFPKPHHWNQAVLLEVPADIAAEQFSCALDYIASHHDAFRLRFRNREGQWLQEYVPEAGIGFTAVDLDPAVDHEEAIRQACEQAQQALNYEQGPVLRAVLLRSPRGNRLLLAAHHLVADGVTFRILIEDLQRLLDQLARGAELQLPLKTASYGAWSAALESLAPAESEDVYWQSPPARVSLPTDHDRGENTEASAETVELALAAGETQVVLRTPAALRVEIRAVLIAALSQALRQCWPEAGSLLMELEGHGRDQLPGLPDVSRTAGWFTSLFPFAVPEANGDLEATLRQVHQELARVPNMGIGYGNWRDRHSGATPRPPVLFNYLGQFGALTAATRFRLAREEAGGQFDSENSRPHLLQIVCAVYERQLVMRCIYSRNKHARVNVERLLSLFAAALRQLAGTATVVDDNVSAEDLRVLRERYGA